MPSLRKTSKLPVAVLKKLKVLDTELEEEDITVKGYCKRKWAILQQYASKNIAKDVKRIHAAIAQKKTDEKEAYSKMLDLLRIEHLFINGKLDKSITKVLGSTENIPQDVDLIELEYSVCVDNTLKNSIINISQKVDNPIKNILGSTENLPQKIDLTEPGYSTPDNTHKNSNISFEKLVHIESSNISNAQKIVKNIPVNINTKLTKHSREEVKELSPNKLNVIKRKNTRQSTFQNSIIRNFQKLINTEPPSITENPVKNKPVNKNRRKSTEPTTKIHEKTVDKSLTTIEKSLPSDSEKTKRKNSKKESDSCEKTRDEYTESIEESSLTKSKIKSEKNTKQITFKTSIIRNNIVQIEPPNVPVNKNKRKSIEPSNDSQEKTKTKKLKIEELAACDNKIKSTESVNNSSEKTKDENVTIEEPLSANKRKTTRQTTFKTSNFKNVVQIEPLNIPNSQKVIQIVPVNINKQRKSTESAIECLEKTKAGKLKTIASTPRSSLTKSKINERKSTNSTIDSHDKDNSLKIIEECPTNTEINKIKSTEQTIVSRQKTSNTSLKKIEELLSPKSEINIRKDTRQSTFKTSIIKNFQKLIQTESLKIKKVVQNVSVNKNKRKCAEQPIDSQEMKKAKKLKIIKEPTDTKKKTIKLSPPTKSDINKRKTKEKTYNYLGRKTNENLKTIKETSTPKLEKNLKTIEEALPIKTERSKRSDTVNESPPSKTKISLPKNNFKPDYCDICNQYLSNPNLLKYKGHPKGSVNEFVAINDKKMLFTNKENETNNSGQLRHYKITQFSVYDKNDHLCPFDSGLIENNTKLFFSGYVKPISDENTSVEGGVPAKDMGPIKEWWTSGFGGGENAIVGFTTTFGEYYLMEPSNEYKPFMKPAREKIYLSKVLIEFLLKTCWQNPTYKDLLIHLQTCKLPANFEQFTEDDILRHAQFICEQVSSFDAEIKENNLFMSTSCMRSLVESAGVTYIELQEIRKEEKTEINKEEKKEVKEVKSEIEEEKNEFKEVKKEIKEVKKEAKTKKKPRRSKNLSKATTTELVREVFDSFFPEQLDKNKEQNVERKRCGKCKNCKKPDCGKCRNCKEKNKRPRRCKKEGKNNQDCMRHKCTNTKIQTADDSETDDSLISDSYIPPVSSKHIFHSATWLGDPITEQNGRTYYSSAKVGNEVIKPGDHVMLKPDKRGLPLLVAKVTYMWDQITGGKYFHAHIFCRGTDTVLGEIGDRRELFQVDECENCPLGSIVKKAEVEYKLFPPYLTVEDDSKFFCQKRYDRKKGRFEDIFDDKLNNDVCSIILGYKPCASCKRKTEKEKLERPILEEEIIYWRNEHFKIGTGVYLLPGTFEFKTAPVLNSRKKQTDQVDEDIYPEFYRKKSENIIGIEISEPFCIGYITEILTEPNGKQFKAEEIELRVKKLYRPENTHKGETLSQQLDINIVYWSEEEVTIPFSKITGKCHITYGDILDVSVEEWCSRGPNRFYFLQSYNSETQEFESVEKSGMFVGQLGKTKNLLNKSEKNNLDEPEEWFSLEEPLKTMDVFAGCGGLSEGLHQSGVADTKWAIENDTTAAQSFKENNRQTIVYSVDCNKLLAEIISGKSKTGKGQPLPRRGDVELMVGGPPCQGFSGMNRFNAGQYSLFKNSLIVSYLSYCDFYRPKFFILENVRNFVTFKSSMVLKLTLRCLLAMGYQCTFGVVQAGNYGVPQIRRRSIIFAAAPGEILPEYPEPLHVFTSKRANPLDIVIDNCRYNTGSKWLDSGAPYRTITVRDAMSDLPPISNGCSTLELSYDSEPLSHFQRVMRGPGDQTILRDHICKEMAPLVEARISCIPNESGSDWRDLPNIEIQLSDGTMTNKLKYEWNDKRNGKNSKGSNRGVCPCASNKPCDASVRQYNTLIPWCLPHTANRHNNWAGLFGRLDWDGVFNTTVTNPEPIGKQGRVLHPVQNRVVSVRECARSQGFPDKYKFYGNLMDKHRQVGNAVPPPMGKAIGQEILKSVIFNKPKNKNC